MVNKSSGTKKIILSMLRNSDSSVSGEQMSEKLGISRVAIWKHIKTLKELGYKIVGSSTGYILQPDNDFLYSWEFDTNADLYMTYKELSSTMEKAKEEAEKKCSPFKTIIAETQSAGKGQADRNWQSDKGGLYFTTILRPQLPSAYTYLYTFAATAVLSEVIRSLYNLEAEAKWPNDLLINGKKIAGVLTENHSKGTKINWLNLGIGINANNNPQLSNAESLKNLCGRKIDRKELLTTFEKRYKATIETSTPDEICNLWKRNNQTINSRLDLKSGTGECFKGIAIDIDRTGSLLIMQSNNKVKQALFGDLYIKE